MQILVGLGNPGKKYQKTRHNVGWLALDYISQDFEISGEQHKFDAIIKEGRDPESGEKILLVYPQTFMNDSGKAVAQILNFYKLSPRELLVLQDEVDLPLGTVRLNDNSSSAGHNGVKSIIDALGTQEFRRLRIGVEGRENKKIPDTHDYVLQEFTAEQLPKIPFEQIREKVLEQIK